MIDIIMLVIFILLCMYLFYNIGCGHKSQIKLDRKMDVDIDVGDIIQTRKKHPCGASSYEVLREGMDYRNRCTGCGREVMLPRVKIEKNIKKVIRPDGQSGKP